MPKETLGTPSNQLMVTWGDDPYCSPQIGLDLNQPFTFKGDSEEFTSLWFDVYTESMIDELIAVLQRVKKNAAFRK